MTITFIVARLFLEGNDLFVYIEHKLILYTNAKNPNKQLNPPPKKKKTVRAIRDVSSLEQRRFVFSTKRLLKLVCASG